MKQIAFALQVFSLMALLPALVIFDMNYETGRSAEIHSSTVATEKTGETATPVAGNSKTTRDGQGIKPGQSIRKDSRSCDSPRCTCKKCSCGSDCRCNDMKIDHSLSGIKGLFSTIKLQKRS